MDILSGVENVIKWQLEVFSVENLHQAKWGKAKKYYNSPHMHCNTAQYCCGVHNYCSRLQSVERILNYLLGLHLYHLSKSNLLNSPHKLSEHLVTLLHPCCGGHGTSACNVSWQFMTSDMGLNLIMAMWMSPCICMHRINHTKWIKVVDRSLYWLKYKENLPRIELK